MKRTALILISLSLLLLLAACSPSTPAPVATPQAPSGYPYPGPGGSYPSDNGSDPSAAYVPPDVAPVATTTPLPTPTTDPVLGIIRGQLINNNTPLPGASMHLAKIIKDESGKDLIASYSRTSSPAAVSDENGVFVFVNIEPGRYALILDTVISAYLMHYPDKEEQIIITVDAGKTTDMGTLAYNDLPITPP